MNGGIVWRYVSEDRHVRCIVNKIKLVAYQRIPRHCDTRWRDGVYYSTIIFFFFFYFNHESTRARPFIPLHRPFTKLQRRKQRKEKVQDVEFDGLTTRFTAHTQFNVTLRTCIRFSLFQRLSYLGQNGSKTPRRVIVDKQLSLSGVERYVESMILSCNYIFFELVK